MRRVCWLVVAIIALVALPAGPSAWAWDIDFDGDGIDFSGSGGSVPGVNGPVPVDDGDDPGPDPEPDPPQEDPKPTPPKPPVTPPTQPTQPTTPAPVGPTPPPVAPVVPPVVAPVTTPPPAPVSPPPPPKPDITATRTALLAALQPIPAPSANAGAAAADTRSAELRRLDDQVSALEADLARTQEALRRLSRQVQTDSRAMDEWVALSNQTIRSTWKRSLTFTADMLIAMPSERLTDLMRKRATGLGSQMDALLERYVNATDPAARAQARAALAQLRRERDILSGSYIKPRPGFQAVSTVPPLEGALVGNAQRLVQNIGEAKTTYDLAQWSASNAGDFERLEEGTNLLADMMFSQVEAPIDGWKLGTYVAFGRFFVGTAQDILAQCLSVQRVNQLERNSEESLRAVNALSAHMRKTVETLQAKRAEQAAAAAAQATGGGE